VRLYSCSQLAAALATLALASVPASGQEINALSVPDVRTGKAPAAPRTADGHPDLSGYWKGTRDTKPVGNIAKDLPGLKLPLTPAGEAALKHNLTATIDPESLCIIGESRGTMPAVFLLRFYRAPRR